MGDWRQFTVGISDVLDVIGIVSQLSPLDSQGYPNATPSEVMALPFEVGFESREFFELIAIYMSDLKNNIAQERIWKAQQQKVN